MIDNMKTWYIAPFAAALMSVACSSPVKKVHPEWTYSSVVYEVNVRQFSPEGTFKGVARQLLCNLGLQGREPRIRHDAGF